MMSTTLRSTSLVISTTIPGGRVVTRIGGLVLCLFEFWTLIPYLSIGRAQMAAYEPLLCSSMHELLLPLFLGLLVGQSQPRFMYLV